MANSQPLIDSSYEQSYAKRAGLQVYTTEFLVRAFLGELSRPEVPQAGGWRSCARHCLRRWSQYRVPLRPGLRGERHRDHGGHRPADWRAAGERLAKLGLQADPYGNRDGYRLHAFSSKDQIEAYPSPWLEHFSFGFADNDYYGVSERLFWVVCQKREGS